MQKFNYKNGVAVKGDYGFDELKTWLDSNLQLSIQLKSNSLGNSKSKGLLFFSYSNFKKSSINRKRDLTKRSLEAY